MRRLPAAHVTAARRALDVLPPADGVYTQEDLVQHAKDQQVCAAHITHSLRHMPPPPPPPSPLTSQSLTQRARADLVHTRTAGGLRYDDQMRVCVGGWCVVRCSR